MHAQAWKYAQATDARATVEERPFKGRDEAIHPAGL